MTVQLRPEQEKKIHELIESGRFHTPEEVVSQAIEALLTHPNESAEEKHRVRLLEFLEQPHLGWDLEKHPELDRGASHWVESIRHADEQMDA